MLFLNQLQAISAVLVILIQVYRCFRKEDNPIWAIIKGYFNFLTLQVYLISMYSETTQIYLHFKGVFAFSDQQNLYNQLYQILVIQSISIYFGITFIIIFIRNLQNDSIYQATQQNCNIRRMMKLIQILIKSLIQVTLVQSLFFIMAFIFSNYNEVNSTFYEILQLNYVQALLLFSAISSMSPIMQVLLETPLINFMDSLHSLTQPFIKEIKFKYVQLQQKFPLKDEEMAELNMKNQSQQLAEFNIYTESEAFDDEFIDEMSEQTNCDKLKQNIIDGIQCCCKTIRLFYRSILLIYNTIQLVLAFVLIFGFICIFIQIADPNSRILSELNAISYFSTQLDMSTAKSQQQENLESVIISIFKIIFIVVMYFSTNNRIKYSKNKQLIDDVTNLSVIIRKNLLNFSFIALLTTLYPNLTFTTNNSDCFSQIFYSKGNHMQIQGQHNIKQYNWDDTQCPVTLIYLITIKVFEGNITIMIGLCILLLYIMTAIYILLKYFKRIPQ